MGLFTKLFGTRSEREGKKLEPQVEAVMALERKYRVPLLLFYYEGYSTAEIASMLSIAEKTVSTRLYRARAKLRTILEEE